MPCFSFYVVGGVASAECSGLVVFFFLGGVNRDSVYHTVGEWSPSTWTFSVRECRFSRGVVVHGVAVVQEACRFFNFDACCNG